MIHTKLYNLLIVAISALTMLACSVNTLNQSIIEAGTYDARVDLVMNGAFDENYFLHGGESILTLTDVSHEDYHAKTLMLQISENERIELTLVNATIEDSWDVPFTYSAFSSLILPMRETYTIANYFNKDVLIYSTTSGSAAEDHIQTYVLEIIETNDASLMVRFHDMQLFSVEDNLTNRQAITIKGTFNTTFL